MVKEMTRKVFVLRVFSRDGTRDTNLCLVRCVGRPRTARACLENPGGQAARPWYMGVAHSTTGEGAGEAPQAAFISDVRMLVSPGPDQQVLACCDGPAGYASLGVGASFGGMAVFDHASQRWRLPTDAYRCANRKNNEALFF